MKTNISFCWHSRNDTECNKSHTASYAKFKFLFYVFLILGTTAYALEVPIKYTVPHEGTVSLAIYNSSGQLVRTLLSGAKRSAGNYTEVWDGRDRYGVALPAGAYKYRVLVNKGLVSEFVTTLGATLANPSDYPAGNMFSPLSTVSDGSKLYRSTGNAENVPWAVCDNLMDGRREWVAKHERISHDFGGAASCIVNNTYFNMYADGKLVGYNTATGDIVTGSNSNPAPWNISWTGTGGGSTATMFAKGMDMDGDASANLLVVSYRAANAISWFNASNGSKIDEVVGITAPMGIACAPNGTVYVISEGAVYKLSRSNKTPVKVIDASLLQHPWRLAVDNASGNIFVAENSSYTRSAAIIPLADNPHYQVKKFSEAGALLSTVGRADGRQDGAYVPTDFYHMSDISADGHGGFIVSEPNTPPRRVARFDSNGNLIKEWYGGQHWGITAAPEPTDHRYAWFGTNPGGLVRAKIDFTTNNWTIVETYTRSLLMSGVYGNGNAGLQLSCTSRGGKIYLYTNPSAQEAHGSWFMALYDPATKTIRITNHTSSKGFWNDLNDNGIAESGEYVSGIKGAGYVEAESLRIYTTKMSTGDQAGPVYKPVSFTAGGTPVYSSTGAGLDGSLPRLSEWDVTNVSLTDFRRASDGSMYGCVELLWPWHKNAVSIVETYGYWYFNLNTSGERLVKWDAQGNKIWSVGRHSAYSDKPEGTTVNARSILGFGPNNSILLGESSDAEIAAPVVYDENGLYVGELFRKTDGTPYELFAFRQGLETHAGNTVVDPVNNVLYVYLASTAGGASVYRIKGWNEWHYAVGNVSLTTSPQPLSATGTGLKAEYFNNINLAGSPVYTTTDPQVLFRWRKNAPASGVNADNFSVRWSGQVEAIYSDVTVFGVEGDDNWEKNGRPNWYKLYVDGKLILERSGMTVPTSWQQTNNLGLASIQLVPGKRYDIKLEAGFATGEAGIRLVWESKANDRRHILKRYLYPTGYTGETKTEGGISAHWRFDETSGTLANDASGNNNTLQLSNTTWTTSALQGGAVEFTATSNAGTSLVNVSETEYTASLWFITNADGGLLACADPSGTQDRALWIEEGKLKARINGTTSETLTSESTVSDGKWHHVAHIVSKEFGWHRLYVDGILQSTGSVTESMLTNQDKIVVGRVGDAKLVGVMEEVFVYNKALTPEEVSTLFRSQVLARIKFDAPDEPLVLNSGDVTYGAGRTGNAAKINGSGSTAAYIRLDNRSLALPNTDYGVAFWVKTTSPNVTLLSASRMSVYNNRTVGHLVELKNGQVHFDGLTSSILINDDSWHHIGTVYDSKEGAKLYIDGNLVASDPNLRERINYNAAINEVGIPSNLQGLTIGKARSYFADDYANAPFTIDELCYQTRVMSAEEIAKLASESAAIVPVTGVTITPTTTLLYVRGTQQLIASVEPSNASNKGIIWTSSNTAVATVSASGFVTGVGEGTATITAITKEGGYTATCTVEVTVQPVTGVTISPSTVTINYGTTQQLTALVEPSNASNPSVKWTSNNTSVVTVSESGLIKAVGPGSAIITVTTLDGGKTATTEVTVIFVPVVSVSISPSSVSLRTGNTQRLTASINPSHASIQTIRWSSNNPLIATVDSTGVVTAIGGGTAIITATSDDQGKTATATIKVVGSNNAIGTGLKAEYYNTKNFKGPVVLSRIDATVNFKWDLNAPAPQVNKDGFSVRWTGQVLPKYSETYTFYTNSDDGVRLWVNNTLIINNWTNHGNTVDKGTITLVAGTKYNIKMEYYEDKMMSIARLSWSSPSQPKQVIPQTQLFPSSVQPLEYSVHTTQIPENARYASDYGDFELGMRFKSAVPGKITQLIFYKMTGETGTHTAHLWTENGMELARATFTEETELGWQAISLTTPINIDANTIYIVSVNANVLWPINPFGMSDAIVNGPLSSIAGSNGVFHETPGTFPTVSWQDTNYFVDILFVPDGNASARQYQGEERFVTEDPRSHVKMYANPATEYVQFDECPDNTEVIISDLQGRKMYEGIISHSARVPLIGMSAGVYMVKLKNASGEVIEIKRLVIR